MDSENRYSFRKRDYAKIKDWYAAAQSSYFPEDKIKDDKAKVWHFKIQMEEIELTQQFVHNGLKNLNAVKEIVLFSSIFQRNQNCSVSQCKQIRRYCDFKFSSSRINFSEDITLYFYLQDSTSKLYELRLEIQIITKDGIILKLGSVSHTLSQESNSKTTFSIYGRFNPKWKVDQDKKYEKEVDQGPQPLGKIDANMEYEEIKQITKLLPAFVIIDQNSKIPPCSTFSLRKKKEQIILDQPFKLGMQNLLFHISNPALLKQELMANNPFTMSHKEVVQCSIKQYSIILDMHNGWKFLNHGKNSIILEQILQNQSEIYLSSKSTQKLSLSYYDSEGIVFLILLRVKAEFRVSQIGKCKSEQFLLGWLPLPLDLSLKENKVDMFLVCDQPFPAMELLQINTPANVSAIITHPLYSKYKARQDDRKAVMSSLPLELNDFTEPHKYIGPHAKKRVASLLSSKQIEQKQSQIQEEIENLKKIIEQNEKQKQLQRFINVIGKVDLGEQKINIPHTLDVERIVGKILKLRVEFKSLIPETETPSSYYLPKKLEATLYLLRNIFHLNCSINENSVRYNIPISLNSNKSSINVRIFVDSLRQFEELSISRLVLVLNQEGNMLPYARGHLLLSSLIGEQKDEKVSYLRLFVWQEQKEKCFGTIMLNSNYELENIKVNHTKVQEVKLEKEIQKLPMEERLKLRIGNFKGDNEPKNKVVNILKQKKHLQYISSVVEGQLLCDGEISYEIGFDSYYLFCFINEQKSQNNIFTFHIDCPYAQLITQEDQYRKTMIQMNVEFQNYKFLQYVPKQNIGSSYYQTNLAFNQAIGLLLRLNVNQIKQGGLKKIQLIVKRNTFPVRRFILKCNYKQPLIWDTMEAFEVIQPQQQQARISLPQYLSVNYRDFQVLNENITYDFRTKEIVFLRRGISIYEVYLTVSSVQDKRKRVIILKSHFLRGKEISITAGQKISTSIETDDRSSIQIIHSHSREAFISSPVKFNNDSQLEDHISIQMLNSVRNYPIIVSGYELSGQKIWSYLIKVNSNLCSNYSSVDVWQIEGNSFAISCQNPYAISCFFDFVYSSKNIKLEEKQVQLGSYSQRLVVGFVLDWSYCQLNSLIFQVDKRGNIIKVTEIIYRKKEQTHRSHEQL